MYAFSLRPCLGSHNFAVHVPITFPFVRCPPPKNRPHPSTRFPPRELSFPTSGLARLLLSPSLIGFQFSQAPLPHFLSVNSPLLCVTPNRTRPDLLDDVTGPQQCQYDWTGSKLRY
ncbi:hypothetical protein HPB47_008666 [Ixodes persulcatus]|uniref:Uncharacterized protein n=1 Tax=Ixodes persulcatus TaxID=34615 RepID=A0AC60P4E3_IXOPE|nr:hypothetical protein HPB47_008666 [Ixodes persulcatus]